MSTRVETYTFKGLAELRGIIKAAPCWDEEIDEDAILISRKSLLSLLAELDKIK